MAGGNTKITILYRKTFWQTFQQEVGVLSAEVMEAVRSARIVFRLSLNPWIHQENDCAPRLKVDPVTIHIDIRTTNNSDLVERMGW